MKLLDRYLLRNFLEPFFICSFGFLAIWLVFDLADNGQDFMRAENASFARVGYFYLTQLPQIILISMPVGMLLALVFCLSRMSRSNEIISMLTAGQSIWRIILPLVIAGLVLTGGLVLLNYEAAPRAEATKKAALEQITRGRKAGKQEVLEGYFFRERQNSRTWFIKRFRQATGALDHVHITQNGPDGSIASKWYAKRAQFDAKTRTWTLERGMRVDFSESGDVIGREDFQTGVRKVEGWAETPWRIASAQYEPQNLTVPELREYLRFNGDFPEVQLAPYRAYLYHRWAFPFQALVVVFIGAPLAIVFSRRGVVGGVAAAIFLYAGLLLSTYLFLALGKGWRMNAIASAWVPNAFFFVLGLILLYFRSTNRDLPSLTFKRK
ncbi:MAG: LptF/LptG family permease [Chthoniobacteraceae bacterium]